MRQCGAQPAAACAAPPHASGSQPRAVRAACQGHRARQRAMHPSMAVAPLYSTATSLFSSACMAIDSVHGHGHSDRAVTKLYLS